MKTISKQFIFIIVLPLIFLFLFSILLITNYYAYLLYVLLGFVFYLITKLIGREMSFIFIIPVLIFALALTGSFFLLDINDNNGLNPLKIHPFILSWLINCFLYFIEDLLKKKIIFNKITILSILVIFLFCGITFIFRGMSGISLAIHNYIGPISFFLFFYSNKKIDFKKIDSAVLLLISISVLIGILGIIEYITQFNVLQDLYKSNTGWLNSTTLEGYRIKTILGHPLDNAIYFLFSMIIVQIRIENVKLKYALLLLFIIDILLTGSRSIFVVSFMVLLYNKQVFSGGLKTAKQYLITIFVIGITASVTLHTSLGSTFINRAGSAGDSTEARFLLLDYFIRHLTSFQMMGLGGATENIKIIGRFNTPIILENPWIILFFDVGYFLILYIILLIFILRRIEHKILVIILIFAISGFASFGVRSNINYFIFYLLTYGFILTRKKKCT